MARRGWVSAEVAPDTWRRLSVFDDGWVELPGFARSFSDSRAQLRSLGRVLVVVLVAGAAMFVVSLLDLPGVVGVVPAAVFVGALLWAVVLGYRQQSVNFQQNDADHRQARREKAAGQQLRRAPGAPLWRRASTAAEMAGWLDGVTHVAASSVLGVEATVEDSADGSVHVVRVRLSDGTVRRYASPDEQLPRLLMPFAAVG